MIYILLRFDRNRIIDSESARRRDSQKRKNARDKRHYMSRCCHDLFKAEKLKIYPTRLASDLGPVLAVRWKEVF